MQKMKYEVSELNKGIRSPKIHRVLKKYRKWEKKYK